MSEDVLSTVEHPNDSGIEIKEETENSIKSMMNVNSPRDLFR